MRPDKLPAQPDKSGEERFLSGARGQTDQQLLDRLKPVEQEGGNRDTVLFNLRLPRDLHAQLKAVADSTGRSMHEVCLTVLEPMIREAYDRYAR